MKIQPRSVEAFLSRPEPHIRFVLLYGPDEGLARERAQQLKHVWLGTPADPMAVEELTSDQVGADPAALADACASMSFFSSGPRFVYLRPATDKAATAIEALLKAPPGGSWLVVAGAGELPTSSRLRKLAEAHNAAAAIPCYIEDERSLSRIIQQTLSSYGIIAEADALAYLAAMLVGDRAILRQELDKIRVYWGERSGRLLLEDARMLVGDSAEAELDHVVQALLAGDRRALDRALSRAFASGESPIGLVRVVGQTIKRLHISRVRLEQGASAEQAVQALQPPLFFKARDGFLAALRRWDLPLLDIALARLFEIEAACKKTGAPDVLLVRQLLLAMTR